MSTLAEDLRAESAAVEWTPWGGGRLPMHASEDVKIMLRNGAVRTGTAGQYSWSHLNAAADIVAYCIVRPEDAEDATDPRDYAEEHAHGGMSRWAYEDDPKRLAFTAARYKHAAKLLEGRRNVLEVGCADGYYSRIVRQHVERLTAIDTDPRSIAEAYSRTSRKWPIEFRQYDVREFVRDALKAYQAFDAVYTLDVLEHMSPDESFLRALHHVAPVAVIGTPSVESQQYASPRSREGHVNCYAGPDLKARLEKIWRHVFMFTMHDETLGTGYMPMAQYLLALCVR